MPLTLNGFPRWFKKTGADGLSPASLAASNSARTAYASALSQTTRSLRPLPSTRMRAGRSPSDGLSTSPTFSVTTSPTRNPARTINANQARSRTHPISFHTRSRSSSRKSRGKRRSTLPACRLKRTGFGQLKSPLSSARKSKNVFIAATRRLTVADFNPRARCCSTKASISCILISRQGFWHTLLNWRRSLR